MVGYFATSAGTKPIGAARNFGTTGNLAHARRSIALLAASSKGHVQLFWAFSTSLPKPLRASCLIDFTQSRMLTYRRSTLEGESTVCKGY